MIKTGDKIGFRRTEYGVQEFGTYRGYVDGKYSVELEGGGRSMKIHLQGIGERNAIKAKDLIVGDVMICNYGATQKIVAVEHHKSGKTVFVDIESEEGRIFPRCRYGADRLVAVQRVN